MMMKKKRKKRTREGHKQKSRKNSGAKRESLQLRSFLDTSVIRKLQGAHQGYRTSLASQITPPRYINKYVLMESYKSLLLHWIHLYSESRDSTHRTFGDAVAFLCNTFSIRKLKANLEAVMSLCSEHGFSPNDERDKEVCRQKLADLIFAKAIDFDQLYVDVGIEPTNCARINTRPQLSDLKSRDEVLFQFERHFNDVRTCRSRCSVDNLFKTKYAQQMRKIAMIPRQGPSGKLAEQISQVIQRHNGDPRSITCHSCGKMGDAIIAVSMPKGWTLHSCDHVHRPLCTAIGKEFRIHPSIAQYKKQQGSDRGQTAGE